MAVSPASAYADTRAPSARVGASAHSSHAALVDGLDATLRELVRREGVDPQRDADVVRRLAEGVVRRHDDHSLTGAVAPLADPDAVVGELLARVSGFGPCSRCSTTRRSRRSGSTIPPGSSWPAVVGTS